MPVKKKSNSKSKKELNKAIDEIPALIMEERTKKYQEEAQEFEQSTDDSNVIEKRKQTRIYHPPHRSKTWLFIGVGIFTVCIIVLWALNISTVLYESKNNDDPVLENLKKSQKEFGMIIDTFGGDQENNLQISTTTATTTEQIDDTTNNDLKTKLKEAFGALFTTSTVTSTQIDTVESTSTTQE